MSGRRIAGVVVTGECVANVLRAGKRTIEVFSPVPETASFFTSYFDHSRNAFVAVFEDESFSPIADGGLIPILSQPVVSEDELPPPPALEARPEKPDVRDRGTANGLRRGPLELRHLDYATPEIVFWQSTEAPGSKPSCYMLASWERPLNAPRHWDLRFSNTRPWGAEVNQKDFFALAKIGQQWLETNRQRPAD